MFVHKDATKETFIDTNIKVYRETNFGRLWAGLSFRNSFDGAEYLNSQDQIKTQKLQYITPLVGLQLSLIHI